MQSGMALTMKAVNRDRLYHWGVEGRDTVAEREQGRVSVVARGTLYFTLEVVLR